MRKAPLLALVLIITLYSCKRVCYNCNQYCARCISKTDTTLVTKICSRNGSGSEVDHALHALVDSGYSCALLNDKQSVCDSKGSITSATDYFEKQDYFCELQE